MVQRSHDCGDDDTPKYDRYDQHVSPPCSVSISTVAEAIYHRARQCVPMAAVAIRAIAL